ncbi:MAG: DUF4388 domain-containing protein [Planctomycetes bacterium]|nr:DUF4388 domain-containing protein [Planctomycetota bacterium]
MSDEPRDEVILFVAAEDARRAARVLLEGDGLVVSEVSDLERLRDALRTSARALAVLTDAAEPAMLAAVRRELASRADVDLLAPAGLGRALLDGGLDRRRAATCATDALRLLAAQLERRAGLPPLAEQVAQAAELTAARLGLGRLVVEAVGPAALLACLGPLLAPPAPGEAPAEAGVSRELAAAAAAASTLRSPWPLEEVLLAVEERFDGGGRPSGLAGERIPLAARIVAVAREFARLRAASPDEARALQQLSVRAGRQFDPRVVDAFFRVVRDAEYLRRVEENPGGRLVYVVDADPAFLALAELRLSVGGFAVQTYPDGRAALEAIEAAPPAAVVSEVVLPRYDGVALLARLRRSPATAKLPMFLASTSTDRLTVTKALKLGATDVMAKPVNWDVLEPKLREVTARGATARAGRGVEGSLSQLALPELLQVLALGRRTATIRLEREGETGSIVLERGEPAAASLGPCTGLEAFCRLAGWQHGTFRLESPGSATPRNLHGAIESLLLEALRRQDEASRGGGAGFDVASAS